MKGKYWIGLVALAGALGATATAGASTASLLGPTNAARRTLALDTAQRLIAVAPLPVGVTSVSAAYVKAHAPSVLSVVSSASPDRVTLNHYYEVPSSVPLASWLNDQRIDGRGPSSTSSSSGPEGGVQTVGFGGPTTSIVNSSELLYAFTTVMTDETFLDVEAQTTYLPRKSPLSIIATGATTIVVNFDRGFNVKVDRYEHATTTNVALIDSIIEKVNALPAMNPGVMMCPADFGAQLTLRFFDKGASEPYAIVIAQPDGCGVVKIDHGSSESHPTATTTVAGGGGLSYYVTTQLGLKGASL